MKPFVTRFWFPLCLASLLLAAIPGFVLFGLNLFGYERRVNQWLEDTFHLSYHIPVPWWAISFLLLLPFAILLLYFLKLKRKPLSVPSTFLWKKSIEDLHVNSLFQWLRENVLLLLQILAVLAMIYGVMAFHLHGRSGSGKHYILLIDNSASMSATDVAPNRLGWAKQEALKEIDAATDDDIGMVIEFNSSAAIKQSYTSNRSLLRQAVREIEPTQRPTRIEEALTLADSLANPTRSGEDAAVRPAGEDPSKARSYVAAEGIATEVHLFSDGRFPDVPEFSLGNLDVRYHAAGQLVLEAPPQGSKTNEPVLKPAPDSADNVAIVTFNATRDERDPNLFRVFVRAANYRSDIVRTKVQLEVIADGTTKGIHEQPLVIDARKITEEKDIDKETPVVRDYPGENSTFFELTDIDDRANITVHARLTQLNDKLPLDDEAWLAIGVIRKSRVLIVGGVNEALEKFFFDNEATAAVADVKQVGPDFLQKDEYRQAARNGEYDLIIFDRCGPADEKDMPRSNTFFLGYPPPPWTKEKTEKMESPSIKGWMHDHPLLRYLSALYEVKMIDAFRLKDLPPRTPRLIETDRDAAVLVSLQRGPFTDLVMTFALFDEEGRWNSNWPLQPSFPLFLRNVLYTLGNVSDAANEENTQPGHIKTLRPQSVVRRGLVTGPDGKEKVLEHSERDPRTDFVFGDTDRVGIYRVQWENSSPRSFAVNLLDPEESQIEPRPVVQIGAERQASGQESRQPREVWKWFALAALLILLLEWYIYNRRIYV
jgi:hypothetical protein